MERPLLRIAALAGAAILFLCGLGWYLSMGMWDFSLQSGFAYMAQDPSLTARYDRISGPFTLELDLEDPRIVRDKTLYKADGCTVQVTRVDKVSDRSCRLWFRATGDLNRSRTLVSACLPQASGPLLLSTPAAQPPEEWQAYLSNYDTDLGARGNQFAVTLFCEEAPEETQLELVFRELQRVTFEEAD